MSISERDAVVRERAAFVAGWWRHREVADYVRVAGEADRDAEARYPLPKVTRLREVSDPHVPGVKWMFDRMRNRFDTYGASLKSTEALFEVPTPERVAVWADLLANPVEEVET